MSPPVQQVAVDPPVAAITARKEEELLAFSATLAPRQTGTFRSIPGRTAGGQNQNLDTEFLRFGEDGLPAGVPGPVRTGQRGGQYHQV